MPLRDRLKGIHLRGYAKGVDHHDCTRAWSDGLFDADRIEIERERVNLDKDWCSAHLVNGARYGDEGE